MNISNPTYPLMLSLLANISSNQNANQYKSIFPQHYFTIFSADLN